MTYREFYQAIITNEANAEDVRVFAQMAVDKLDERNEKRKGKLSKTAQENIPIKKQILADVRENGKSLAEAIAERCGLTKSKVSALAHQLVEDGLLIADDVKIKGKSNKVKEYTAVEIEAEDPLD